MEHECDEINRLRKRLAETEAMLQKSKELMRDCVDLIQKQYAQIERIHMNNTLSIKDIKLGPVFNSKGGKR